MSEAIPLDTTIRAIVRDVVREEIRAAFDERGRFNARNADATPSGHDRGYLSISRAATLADVAPGTLRRWIKAGRIAARRAGRVYRISRADLDTFLRTGRSAGVIEKARTILSDAD